MGVEMKSQEKGNDMFITSMDTFTTTLTKMFLKPWLLLPMAIRLTSYHDKLRAAVDYMNSFGNELVTRKTKEYRERNEGTSETTGQSEVSIKEEHPSLIDSIIQSIETKKCHFANDEVVGEINFMIWAGMDTTSTSLSFTMMLLGFHQDVQRKVLEELDAVFGYDVDRSVSMEDLNNLKYTEQVIKESLRLYPVVPFVPRNTTEDIKITNYTLPKGYEFDPENFSPERSKGRHPYSFLPFSGGLRKCVGYRYAMFQMKIVLATILRHFTVHPACDIKEMDQKAAEIAQTRESLRLSDNLVENMVAYLAHVVHRRSSRELLPPTTVAPEGVRVFVFL
uniref:(California timema) hypothetical protein n=1 Tax=Timema californicum TaxID=61474 RepID=A0A7R9JC78_TIMCA|nr:unnamed protein product [Timema californicum]